MALGFSVVQLKAETTVYQRFRQPRYKVPIGKTLINVSFEKLLLAMHFFKLSPNENSCAT
jgi:hypothetical protein